MVLGIGLALRQCLQVTAAPVLPRGIDVDFAHGFGAAAQAAGDRMEAVTNERAYELLQLRREYIEANGGAKKKSGARKSAAKKAPAKKAAKRK